MEKSSSSVQLVLDISNPGRGFLNVTTPFTSICVKTVSAFSDAFRNCLYLIPRQEIISCFCSNEIGWNISGGLSYNVTALKLIYT